MATSAAAAAETLERIRRESRRNSILSIVSLSKATKRDRKDQQIAQCFGTSSRCERGTTVLEEHDTWFQPRLLLKYTAFALTIISIPILIAPMVGIGKDNGGGDGIMMGMFGAILGLTVLLLAFCGLEIWTIETIPANMLLSYGVVISLATLGVTVSSIHFIPQGILYDRIVQCAVPNTNTTVRNCATMQIYLDVMTVAQSVVLLSSFSAFMDCCFSFSQRKQEKGKGVADTEKVGNARSSIQFTARRESSAGVRRATRFGSVDETPELDYPPPDKIEEEEITTGNAGPSSIPEAITKQSNEDSSSTRSKIATNTEA